MSGGAVSDWGGEFVAGVRGGIEDDDTKGIGLMKLTTVTNVSVDGVMQGLGGQREDRRGGFERGGWALPLFGDEAEAFLGEVYQRADAFLFGRVTYEIFAGSSARARGCSPMPARTERLNWSTREPPRRGSRSRSTGRADARSMQPDARGTRTWILSDRT